MNQALWYLLKKSWRGKWRQLLNRFRGWKGVLSAGVLLLFLALIAASQILATARGDATPDAEFYGQLQSWLPVGLMLLAIIGFSGGAGLYFRPAEVDFLFPAPLSRRQLLAFLLFDRMVLGLLSALWASIFTMRWAPTAFGGLAGMLLGFAFLQLSAQLFGLAMSALSVRISTRLRRLPLILFGLSFAVAVLWARFEQPATASLEESLAAAVRNPLVRVLVAPAYPFVAVYLAADWSAALMWSAIGVAMLTSMALLIFALDFAYEEGALQASRRIEQRLRRMRQGGGGPLASRASGRKRMRIPRLPAWKGAGPLAWRQGLEASRNLFGIVLFLLAVVGVSSLPLLFSYGGPEYRSEFRAWMPLIMVFSMSLFIPQPLSYDFRRDLDRMAYFKSLPIRPARMAAGQILTPVALASMLQWIGLSVGWILGMPLPTSWFIIVLCLMVPLNWVNTAIDNLLFLWLPYRWVPQEAGQKQFLGRQMFVVFAKTCGLGIAALLSWLVGWLAWVGLGQQLVLAGVVASAVLAGMAWLLTVIVGQAFVAFDVSRDISS